MRRAFAVALLGVIATALPRAAAGQWREDRTWGLGAQAAPEPARGVGVVAPTLLSFALPGAGQHVLGQRRKWVYLALEAAGWALWAERRASARDYRVRYRDYAWATARLQTGPRVDGDFDYYERMTKWSQSGRFDADPASAGVQPELDPATYNGSVWSLASGIHLPPGPPPAVTDPAYQEALAFYEQRAYGSELLWDWTPSPGGQQELARLIEESDSRFGQATTALGAVIANHLLSAADAYLSSRGAVGQARLRLVPVEGWAHSGTLLGGPPPTTGGPGLRPPRGRPAAAWLLVLSVGVGR